MGYRSLKFQIMLADQLHTARECVTKERCGSVSLSVVNVTFKTPVCLLEKLHHIVLCALFNSRLRSLTTSFVMM